MQIQFESKGVHWFTWREMCFGWMLETNWERPGRFLFLEPRLNIAISKAQFLCKEWVKAAKKRMPRREFGLVLKWILLHKHLFIDHLVMLISWYNYMIDLSGHYPTSVRLSLLVNKTSSQANNRNRMKKN